jgi:hypothetical protein
LTQEQARALWDTLCVNRHDASLHFTYHDRMMPAENYAVIVNFGPGSLPADRLRNVIDIADEHGCDVHLFGNSLRLLPKLPRRP